MSGEDLSWESMLFAFFDDLEAQAEAEYAAERAEELTDRSRAEYLHVSLSARLMAETGTDLVLEIAGVGVLAGTVERVAQGWMLVSGVESEWIVRLAAITSVRGVGTRAVPELAWPVAAKLRLGSALRNLADAGRVCAFHQSDGGQHEGTPMRVGQDFVEIRGTDDRRQLVLLPLATLAAVQRR